MPTSEHWQIPYVVDVLARERPTSVLDVGAGYGKYGVLAREYADSNRVDALDVNKPRFPVYDRIFLGDVRELDRVLPTDAGRYDMALLIDVIEHMDKPEGYRVLGELTRRAKKVLVASPWGSRRQEVPGKPEETHRSAWYPWDFWGRVQVESWCVYPGRFSRYLHLPRLWQFLVLVSAKRS